VPGGAPSGKPVAPKAVMAGHPGAAPKMGSFRRLKVADSKMETTQKWLRSVKSRRRARRSEDWETSSPIRQLRPATHAVHTRFELFFVANTSPFPFLPPETQNSCATLGLGSNTSPKAASTDEMCRNPMRPGRPSHRPDLFLTRETPRTQKTTLFLRVLCVSAVNS